MRINGTLQYLLQGTDQGFNEDGEPISAEPRWSSPIECFIRTNNRSTRGTYSEGRFTIASYEVLLERMGKPFSPLHVRLTRACKYLGEYEVQDIQNVSLDRIKIIV